MSTNMDMEIGVNIEKNEIIARGMVKQCTEKIISVAEDGTVDAQYEIKFALAMNRESFLRLTKARISEESIATLIKILEDEPEDDEPEG